MSAFEHIYSHSPVFVQNVFVSMYGLKLYYERYFNTDRSFLTHISESQWYARRAIEEMQLENLKIHIRNAISSTDYYKNGEEYRCNDTHNIHAISDLRRFPVLKKETVRTRMDDMLCRQYRKASLITLNTSGTTGTSLRIYVDLESRRKAYDFITRYHQWAGLKDSRNNATFGGRAIVPQNQKSKIFWRYNAAMRNYLFSSYHMSEENLPFYAKKLLEIQPQFIESYPSAVYVLAKFLEDNGISGVHPTAILTSGETLFDYQRETAERVFGCKVFDQYGCTEQALFVSQCEKGTYHVHPEYGIVEILDDNNNPVDVGEVGKIVCTSFMNQAMPLIRYDLGDTAEWGENGCSCGRNFPVINKIFGRHDDYIITRDGKRIGRLDPIFKGINSIKLAQIIQLDFDDIAIKLVPGKNFNADDKNRLMWELRKRVGSSVNIEVHIVDAIGLTKAGKFKSVISMVSHNK